jgi:hypothetical protein
VQLAIRDNIICSSIKEILPTECLAYDLQMLHVPCRTRRQPPGRTLHDSICGGNAISELDDAQTKPMSVEMTVALPRQLPSN